jgi:hypothetical protein
MQQEENKEIIVNGIQEQPQMPQFKIFSQSNMRKIQELQAANDELHRQIVQMEKDINHSADPLTLIAEKERCMILIARNSGEVAKIHAENEERLRRITELEGKNKRLAVEKVSQRDSFMEIRDPHERAKHASNFFLTQSKLEKNADEIFELNQE